MRMISYVRHDADGFESMIFNPIETLYKQNANCETLLWFLTHHIMRMISYAPHDVGGFLIASFPGVIQSSHAEDIA